MLAQNLRITLWAEAGLTGNLAVGGVNGVPYWRRRVSLLPWARQGNGAGYA